MAGNLLGSYPGEGAAFAGVWPSLHDLQVPFVKDARNVIFTSLGIRKMDGWSAPTTFTETIDPIRGMIQVFISSTASLFFATPKDIMKYEDGSACASIAGSRFTGRATEDSQGPASIWSMTNFGNWTLATNGVDAPQINRGAGFVPMTISGQFSTAELLFRKGPYILAFNVATAGGAVVNKFHWCHTDDVDQWSPTVNNAAASLIIRDLKGPIKAGAYLGDALAIYSPDELILVNYLGAPFYFGYKKQLDGIGAVSKACVVSVGRRNYGLSKEGFWVTDGTDFQWIDEPAIKAWFLKRINWGQKSKICAYHEKRHKQVIWYYPTFDSEEPCEGLGYDYTRNAWTIYDFGRTAVSEQGVFNYPCAGSADGKIYFHNIGKDADGVQLRAWLESSRLDFGQPENFKEVLELRTGIHELTGTVSVSISGVHTLNESASYTGKTMLDQSYAKVNTRKMGRYISVLYESSGMGSDFIISSVRFHGATKGVD